MTTPAANGGAACPFADSAQQTQQCTLSTCPGTEYILVRSRLNKEHVIATLCSFFYYYYFRFGSSITVPVDCVGSWSTWTACSVTCGSGQQTQRYTITTQAKNGGKACSATDGQLNTQTCSPGACPGIYIGSLIDNVSRRVAYSLVRFRFCSVIFL